MIQLHSWFKTILPWHKILPRTTSLRRKDNNSSTTTDGRRTMQPRGNSTKTGFFSRWRQRRSDRVTEHSETIRSGSSDAVHLGSREVTSYPSRRLAAEEVDSTDEVILPPLADLGLFSNLDALQFPEDELFLYRRLLLVIRDEMVYQGILEHDEAQVQILLDLLHHLLNSPHIIGSARRELLAVLLRLSTATGLYPRPFTLLGRAKRNPDWVNGGCFGDIFKGSMRDQNVCLKIARQPKNDRCLKSFIREIVIWGHLQHPHILPFYGVYRLGDGRGEICLVSPWMENGTLCDYLRGCPGANRLLLMRDVASGLEHIHDMMIVHGDLKSVNVLVTHGGRACLADFGLASISDTQVIRFATLESTGHQGATCRFEAPELLFHDSASKIHRTTASDMYAYGCVCYEIFTGQIPFYELKASGSVILKIKEGGMPSKPIGDTLKLCSSYGLTDEVWSFITSCWRRCPGERPTANSVLSKPFLKDLQDLRPCEPRARSPSHLEYAPGFSTDPESKLSASKFIDKLLGQT